MQQLIEKTRSKSQAIVSGFGYLMYAGYLGEVEHKGSAFTRAVGGHLQFYYRNLGKVRERPEASGRKQLEAGLYVRLLSPLRNDIQMQLWILIVFQVPADTSGLGY